MFKNYGQIFECLTLEDSLYFICFSLVGFEFMIELWISILIVLVLFTQQSELVLMAI